MSRPIFIAMFDVSQRTLSVTNVAPSGMTGQVTATSQSGTTFVDVGHNAIGARLAGEPGPVIGGLGGPLLLMLDTLFGADASARGSFGWSALQTTSPPTNQTPG